MSIFNFTSGYSIQSCGRQYSFLKVIMMYHVSHCYCIGDDFPNAHSLLEAVLASEEEGNAPTQTGNSPGNAVELLVNCSYNV